VILDDAECAVLASYYPDLKPRYDGLPLNVMRADLCRVLAIYYFGGYYKDLDVDWRRPLNVWIRPADDVVYVWEDDEHLCQWFFAAKPTPPSPPATEATALPPPTLPAPTQLHA
jgi:mannosyltransferase OCH1-like enzyme